MLEFCVSGVSSQYKILHTINPHNSYNHFKIRITLVISIFFYKTASSKYTKTQAQRIRMPLLENINIQNDKDINNKRNDEVYVIKDMMTKVRRDN